MDQENQLRQLIRESIQEYIREVETSGNMAAQEAKIKACEEAIALREKKANMEGLDEAYHDMMDSTKINEIKKEIKELQKYKAKAEKVLEKMKMKSEGKTTKKMEDEGMEDEGMVDEVNLDEYTADPAAGPELEEETEQVYEMLLMQKRAGIISETEYKAKVEEAKKKMTAAQKEKKEDIVKGMKKSKSFGKSKDEKSKMYATATKLATKKTKSLKEEVQALFEDEINFTDKDQYHDFLQNRTKELENSKIKLKIYDTFSNEDPEKEKFSGYITADILKRTGGNANIRFDATLIDNGGYKLLAPLKGKKISLTIPSTTGGNGGFLSEDPQMGGLFKVETLEIL
jgi:hypothetical protein